MELDKNKKICARCKIEKELKDFSLLKKEQKYFSHCKKCNAEKAKIYRENNKEKVRESKIKHAAKYKEKIAAAQKIRNDRWYSQYKIQVSLYRHTLNNRYRRYVSNCKDRNREFLLTKEEFKNITSQKCYYCDGYSVSESTTVEPINLDYCGIDRVDNTKSYILENCVPCCNICNRMKLELTKEDFYFHIKKIMDKINDFRD